MNKVLVKIYVPMLEEQFDVWIPNNRKIYKVIQLLLKGINEFSNGDYEPNDMPLLYDKTTGIPYDINKSVRENNIANASEIILI